MKYVHMKVFLKLAQQAGTMPSLLKEVLITSTNEIQHTSAHGFTKTYQWVRNGTMLPQRKMFVYVSSTTYQKGASIGHTSWKIWPLPSGLRNLKNLYGITNYKCARFVGWPLQLQIEWFFSHVITQSLSFKTWDQASNSDVVWGSYSFQSIQHASSNS